MVKYLTMEDINDIEIDLQNKVAKYNVETERRFTFKKVVEYGQRDDVVMGASVFSLKFITLEVYFVGQSTPLAFSFALHDEGKKTYIVNHWPHNVNIEYREYFRTLLSRFDQKTRDFRPFKKVKPQPTTQLESTRNFCDMIRFSGPGVRRYKHTADERSLRYILNEMWDGDFSNITTVRKDEVMVRFPIKAVVDFFNQNPYLNKPANVRANWDKKFIKELMNALISNVSDKKLEDNTIIEDFEYTLIRLFNQMIDESNKTITIHEEDK